MESKMTFYPNFPEYAVKHYESFCLLRFFPELWQRNYFLDGKLFMRQHTEFAKEELGTGRCDYTEGADLVVIPHNNESFPDICISENNGNLYVKVREYAKRPKDYRENQLFISYPNANQQRKLFCMYTLWCNQQTNELSTFDVDKMSNFGEFGVLITDTRQFFNRIAKAVDTNETIYKMDCGFVNYLDSRNMKNVMYMNPFIKPAEGFSYQNEFRFCADTNNTEILELDTKTNFNDIAVPIRLREFANSLAYKDGKIIFKTDSRRK